MAHNEEDILLLKKLVESLAPTVGNVSWNVSENQTYQFYFRMDLDHPQLWEAIHELAHAVNKLYVPMSFEPLSESPVIEPDIRRSLFWGLLIHSPTYSPSKCLRHLLMNLPRSLIGEQWNEVLAALHARNETS